jgi:hypothetical protein
MTMPTPPERSPLQDAEEAGIWRAFRALGDYKFKDVLWPEITLGVILGAGGSVLVIHSTTVDERIALAGEVLTLAGVLLAVTFAALAFVVSIPSGSYLRMLGETRDGGMRRFLDPFLVAIGTQIALIVLAFAYRIFADSVPRQLEHVVFAVMACLLLFALFDIAALARQLVRHGILRAIDSTLNEPADGDDQNVHSLSERKGR